MNPAPLLIIMGTILALLAVQRVLARTSLSQNHNLQRNTAPSDEVATASTTDLNTAPAPTPPQQRGRLLCDGLSVSGLDERGINSIKALIRNNDTDAIATFLAFNRPSFTEIDAFLLQKRREKNNEPAPSNTPTLTIQLLAPLNETERKILLEFNPRSNRLISRDLMSRFGGHEFSTYFSHYCARPKSVTLHVPPFDPDRKILEKLTESGIARKGRHIPLSDRLTVLKMSQLRQMAKDLNLDKKFTRKQDATTILATVPGAAVLLSMQYVIDDLFILQPIKEDIVLVKHEWAYLEAYAKMLSHLKI